MSFIFRTIFWLTAATMILPQGSRLGGEEIADFRDFDLELELRAAAMSAWSTASAAAGSCRENPELCQSVANLWSTTVATVSDIANGVASDKPAPEELTQTAANSRKNNAEN
jgi:hypothetical protein